MGFWNNFSGIRSAHNDAKMTLSAVIDQAQRGEPSIITRQDITKDRKAGVNR